MILLTNLWLADRLSIYWFGSVLRFWNLFFRFVILRRRECIPVLKVYYLRKSADESIFYLDLFFLVCVFLCFSGKGRVYARSEGLVANWAIFLARNATATTARFLNAVWSTDTNVVFEIHPLVQLWTCTEIIFCFDFSFLPLGSECGQGSIIT